MPGKFRTGARSGKVLASFQDKCGLGARMVMARRRLVAGIEPRGGLRVRPLAIKTHGDSDGYHAGGKWYLRPMTSNVAPSVRVRRGRSFV